MISQKPWEIWEESHPPPKVMCRPRVGREERCEATFRSVAEVVQDQSRESVSDCEAIRYRSFDVFWHHETETSGRYISFRTAKG